MNEQTTQRENEFLEGHTLLLSSLEHGASSRSPLGLNEHMQALLVAVFATGVVALGSYAMWSRAEAPVASTGPIVSAEALVEEPDERNPFDMVQIEARAAVVYDVHTQKVLYGRNEEMVRPLASLTKLMTSLVAYETVGPEESVAISPTAIQAEGDSGLFAHEHWKLKDLISFLMMTSSNDGANAVALAIGAELGTTANSTSEYEQQQRFVQKMNDRAEELGLSSTTYQNPSGLDSEGSEHYGGAGTALDTAKLLTYVWENQPEVVEDTVYYSRTFQSTTGFIHTAQNTNEGVQERTGILGSKTGYTDEAGGNLAIIYDAGMDHPIVVVVLGSSIDGRFEDVEKLADATNEYIASGWYHYEMAGSTSAI